MSFVVVVDGSTAAGRALDHALSMLEPLGATVTIIHTVELQVLVEDGEGLVAGVAGMDDRVVAESLEDAESRAKHVLNAAAKHAADADADAVMELLYGNPVETVPTYVDEADTDDIFIDHRGLSKRYGGLVGSVAKELVEQASCPVTVVR